MRIALPWTTGRRAEPPDPVEGTPAPPAAPRGTPTAVFAGVLDGRRLWLAIEATAGSLALRDRASGDVIAPASDLTEEEPGWRSVRMDLTGLGGPDETESAYDVVLVPPAGRAPRPVWTAPLPPARPAPDPAGRARWELRRTDEGMLRLHRKPLEPAAELRRASVTGEAIRLTLTGEGDTAALLDDQGRTLATLPVESGADGLQVLLTREVLPDDTETEARVVLGAAAGWLPVRRRADDLLDPGRGAPMPELETDEGTVLVLRWGQQGLLRTRIRTGGDR